MHLYDSSIKSVLAYNRKKCKVLKFNKILAEYLLKLSKEILAKTKTYILIKTTLPFTRLLDNLLLLNKRLTDCITDDIFKNKTITKQRDIGNLCKRTLSSTYLSQQLKSKIPQMFPKYCLINLISPVSVSSTTGGPINRPNVRIILKLANYFINLVAQRSPKPNSRLMGHKRNFHIFYYWKNLPRRLLFNI